MQSEYIESALQWPTASLKTIVTKIRSGATPKGGAGNYLATRSRYVLVRSQNVFDHRFSDQGLANISDAQAAELEGAELQADDVLLNITGDGVTFGRSCLVPGRVLPACVNQHVMLIRTNRARCLPGFLAAWLALAETKAYIESFNAGGSRRAITKGHIESFQVPLPPIDVQRNIADFSEAVNGRIDVLAQTNATLESIAQALFKSWFIDFDPVRAKTEGREPEGMDAATAALFPAAFEESALGLIPKGWKLKPFGSLLEHAIGGDWGSEAKSAECSLPVRVIRGTDIPDICAGRFQEVPRRFVSPRKAAKRTLHDGDLVIEVSGGSKTQPTGRSLYVTRGLLAKLGDTVVPTSFCRLFRGRDAHTALVLARHLAEIYRAGKMWNYQVQSTGLANFQTQHFLDSEMVVVAQPAIYEKFFEVVRPLIDRIYGAPIAELEALRETLLPRLISGKLRVAEVREQLEEALA